MLNTQVDITCKCGKSLSVYWPAGPAWRCDCGELHYIDPAGRYWGTEAIIGAHEKHGYFAGLFEKEPA